MRIDFKEGFKLWPGIKLLLHVISPIEANIPIFFGEKEGLIFHEDKQVGKYIYNEILELYINCRSMSCSAEHEFLFNVVEQSTSGMVFQHPDTEVITFNLIPTDDPDWIV